MARIAGIDLPKDKRIEIGLTYIYGIGRKSAKDILEKTGVNPDTRVKDLTEADENKLREAIDHGYIYGLQAVLHRGAGGHLSGGLCGEGRRLLTATEALSTGGRPGEGVALTIGDSYHGVVEVISLWLRICSP